MDGFDGGALNGPRAVSALDYARASTRWQEQAQTLGKRCDVLAAHPTRNACSLGGKERLAENGLDRLDTRWIESVVALQAGKLGRNVNDVARGRTVAKVDQDRGPDLGLAGKGLRNTVGKRLRQRTGRDVEDYARIGGNRLRRRRGLGLLGRAAGPYGGLLGFRRTKQGQLLGHGLCTSHPIRL